MLRQENISTHILDSELILSSVLRETRENIIISSKKKVAQKDISNFNKLIKRRLKHEPLAYIFNKKEFWSKNFIVNKNTLNPKA